MKYFIKTFGCQMNESDSERIAAFLEKQGYKKSAGMETADLIVVNACSVRQTAIDRIFGLKPKILKLKTSASAKASADKQNPKFILTGCVLKSDKKKFESFFDQVLNIKQFFLSPIFRDREKNGIDYFSIKPKYKSPNSAFVPIMTGCDNFCSYCVVPYARGGETSRSVKEVVNEVKSLIKKGYREITLLGQNVNSYQYGFPQLLQKINDLAGNFQIKFLTSHPKDMSGELINTIAKCKKIYKEIHLPIQSGDNEILRKMNRGYTIEQYKNLIKKIRAKIPGIKISTDVIVGFPGETKKQFQNTVKIFREIKFDKAYVNKYSTRQGTAAAKFKDNVPLEEKKRRWKIINNIANSPRISKPKLIVILGPTASGKSSLAVKLAKKFNGEIVSADSRQIYKGMDIGTGKAPNLTRFNLVRSYEVKPPYIHKGIIHHCVDIASPKKQITVAEYKKLALEAIDKIYKKGTPPHQYIGGGGKIPIICGGTGFYIQAVVEGLNIPKVKPDWKLRKELEKKTTEDLFKELKKIDPKRAKNIDQNNRRRLVRALEIIKKTGKPVPDFKKEPQFDALYIGIKKSLPELKKAINKRVDRMIKMGLEKEVKKLIKKYGWTMVLRNAIGYSEWKDYKDKKIIANAIKNNTYNFAKRQITWFKSNPNIRWVKNYQQAKNLLTSFLS
ncbi:MAG: tRNA (N6-isopentenyl adenosine(37)-C2)-methylthiotransferase MiaB [Patescibacteria group bacterium]